MWGGAKRKLKKIIMKYIGGLNIFASTAKKMAVEYA